MSDNPTEPEREVFALPAEMRDDIIAHARLDAPRECCGIIAGRGGIPFHLYRTTNVAPGNSLYEISPEELIDLEFRQMPAAGTELVAIYHSHPVSEAYPSPTDRELAFWPDAVYLICSLRDPERPQIRGFRLQDGEVAELNLVIQ